MGALSTSDRLLHVSNVHASCRMLVLGVGNAGCNSVVRMAETWTQGPDVALINTDRKALAACPVGRCIVIGEHTTKGLGAGGDATTGRMAAEESAEAIQELLAPYDFVILVGGLGGGTATGALPVLAKAASNAGALTLCLVTTPFTFEGDKRKLKSDEGLRALSLAVDTVICMPNDRLTELADADMPIEGAFRVVDETVATGLHALWRILTQNGLISLNFADVRELFERSGGTCSYGYADASGPARAAEVLQKLLESPLLAKGRKVSEAGGLLVSIVGGPDLTFADVQGMMGQIRSIARDSARLFFGVIVDSGYRDRVSLTMLVTEHWLEDREGRVPARDTLHGLEFDTSEPGDRPSDATAVPAVATTDVEQGELKLEMARGRFEKVAPTYYQGQDLDIPTYARRGLKLSFEQ